MRLPLLYCIFLLLLAAPIKNGNCAETVSIQLRWQHQFQFAGYYAAIEKGYFRQAGFEVIIKEGGGDINTVTEVLDGNAQFGVTNSELMLHRINGQPVVALAAVFQHSPQVFLTRQSTGIRHPQDFVGKRVKMSRSSRDIELHAALKNEGISLEMLNLYEDAATPADYLDPSYDVLAAYITNQSYYFEQQNIAYTVISPTTYGVDFYGDTLFTSQKMVESDLEKVKAFREASLKGWQYAMANQQEIAQLIYDRYSKKKTLSHLLREAEQMRKLILPALVDLGHMNPGRWQHIADTFAKNGFSKPNNSLQGFLFSDYTKVSRARLRHISGILIAIISGFFLVAASLLFFNRRLQREISEHEKTADTLRQTQEELSHHAKQTEQFSLSAASMITVKDEKVLFSRISEAIITHSDYERVLISLFHDTPPYRDLIGYAGVSAEIVEKVRKTELDKSWYDGVFKQGIMLGQSSYYIPHTMKHILNQEATIYGDGALPQDDDSWHPEDNLFVKMSGENGEFLGVISVDTSKSGRKPTNEIVRPLEIYASLISQIIILRRSHEVRENLEQQLRQAQKMEAIGSLTGGIAHDFNNILGILIGNTELALDLTDSNNPLNEYLDEILKTSLKARDIVKHLLTFSRKSGHELRPVHIGSTLEESITFLRSTIPSSITISKDLQVTGCSVLADPTQLHQVILNLCTNAVHAMENKKGILAIEATVIHTQTQLVAINANPLPKGQYIQIVFRDNGCGVKAKHLHRIFDPYFTTKEIGKGTGMGLSIVHGIVVNHNGAIQVSSSPDKGTEFKIYLPVCSDAAPADETKAATTSNGSGNILLIDDNTTLLETHYRLMKKAGYTVTTFSDPVAALQNFSAIPDSYDLVITDMTMPGITGDTLAREVLDVRKDIPVFLCTGYSEFINEQEALKAGIRRYFEKPVNFSDLIDAIQLEMNHSDTQINTL